MPRNTLASHRSPLLTPPTADSRQGVLRVHYRGFGFVEFPDGPSMFVASTQLAGFLDGDVVHATPASGFDHAESLTLVARERTEVFGLVVASRPGKALAVDPACGNATFPLSSAEKLVEGHAVHASLSRRGARAVQMWEDPYCREALTCRILVRHGLPVSYPRAVQDAASVLARQGPSTAGHRRDLTDQMVITIDADHSQDLDDALAVAPARNGDLRVWVHVADVAEYVLPGSVLDMWAASTPTSVYLPDHVRHMFPPELSAGRLSILPHAVREVLTVELLIDAEGNTRAVDVYESLIRSRQRVNYDTVSALIRGAGTVTEGGGEGAHDVSLMVSQLWTAAVRLGAARAPRGGVDARRSDPEPAGARGDGEGHLLVERLMVAANEAVGAWLDERGVTALYRVHPALSDADASALEDVALALGVHASLPRPVTARSLAILAAAVAPTRHADAFWDALMKLLSRAEYAARPGLHFGLGSTCYLHFTSPLRRYADLVVHRQVKNYLAGGRAGELADAEALACRITAVSRNASQAERDMQRALALLDLREGARVTATVLTRGRPARVLVGGVTAQWHGVARRPGETVRAVVTSVDPLTGRLELDRAGPKLATSRASAVKSGSSRKSDAVTSKAGKVPAGKTASKRAPARRPDLKTPGEGPASKELGSPVLSPGEEHGTAGASGVAAGKAATRRSSRSLRPSSTESSPATKAATPGGPDSSPQVNASSRRRRRRTKPGRVA